MVGKRKSSRFTAVAGDKLKYRAPEVLLRRSTPEPPSDIFALGMMLYTAFTTPSAEFDKPEATLLASSSSLPPVNEARREVGMPPLDEELANKLDQTIAWMVDDEPGKRPVASGVKGSELFRGFVDKVVRGFSKDVECKIVVFCPLPSPDVHADGCVHFFFPVRSMCTSIIKPFCQLAVHRRLRFSQWYWITKILCTVVSRNCASTLPLSSTTWLCRFR